MADLRAFLPFETMDPLELDPSEDPRYNVLKMIWPQLKMLLASASIVEYLPAKDREDVRSYAYASRWIGTELISPFLKRQIIEVVDYVEHVQEQAQAYANKDGRISRKEKFFADKGPKTGNSDLNAQRAAQAAAKRERVRAAQKLWKDAIDDRNRILKEYDLRVKALHHAYIAAREER